MNSAVIFALASMVFAGFNDCVFKRYSRKTRSRGMIICAIGVVWVALQLLYMGAKGQTPVLGFVDVGYGLAAGVMVTLSNILLLENLTHLEVSLGSTIYRLNTIGVVVLSLVLLGESLGILKGLGIACGVFGVVLLYRSNHAGPNGGVPPAYTFMWVAVAALLLRACYGVTTKSALSHGADLAPISHRGAR